MELLRHLQAPKSGKGSNWSCLVLSLDLFMTTLNQLVLFNPNPLIEQVDVKELNARRPDGVPFPDSHSATDGEITQLLTDIELCIRSDGAEAATRPSIKEVCKEHKLDTDQTHFVYVTATFMLAKL